MKILRPRVEGRGPKAKDQRHKLKWMTQHAINHRIEGLTELATVFVGS